MRVLGVAATAMLLGCTTTTTASQRTLFTTTPAAPQGFAGVTGANLAGHALLDKPTSEADNSTAFAFVQFEGGAMLRLPDNRTSFGARVSLAPAATGVSQPEGRLRVASAYFAGGFDVQAAHDLPLHPNAGLTAAVSTGLVFSRLVVSGANGPTGQSGVYVGPQLNGGVGFYASVGGFRPYAAVTIGTQFLNSATGVTTCGPTGSCEDSGTVRIGALVMAVLGARFSWRTGAVEAGVLIPVTAVGGRLPVGLSFTVHVGDFVLKPAAKPKPAPPPGLTPPPLIEPPPPPQPPPEVPAL